MSHKIISLKEVIARLDYDVVFVAEDGSDLVRDPLLHQVNVDLFNVDLPIELGWELSRLETLLVDAERHGDNCSLPFGCVRGKTCRVDGVVVKVRVKVLDVKSSRLRLGGSAKAVRLRQFQVRVRDPGSTPSFTTAKTSRRLDGNQSYTQLGD